MPAKTNISYFLSSTSNFFNPLAIQRFYRKDLSVALPILAPVVLLLDRSYREAFMGLSSEERVSNWPRRPARDGLVV